MKIRAATAASLADETAVSLDGAPRTVVRIAVGAGDGSGRAAPEADETSAHDASLAALATAGATDAVSEPPERETPTESIVLAPATSTEG